MRDNHVDLPDRKSLMESCTEITSLYLQSSIVALDKQFGQGYSSRNHTILAAFMQSCATLYAGASLGEKIYEVAVEVEAVHDVIHSR